MSDKQELPEKPAKQQTEAEIREFLSSNAYSALEGIQEGIEAALKDILPQAEAATEIANKAAATVLNELTEDLPKIEPPEMPDFQEIYRVIDEITTEWDKTVDFYNHADKEKILEHWNILDEDQREYILELLSSLKEYGARPEEAAAAYDKLASIVDLEQLKGKDTAEKETTLFNLPTSPSTQFMLECISGGKDFRSFLAQKSAIDHSATYNIQENGNARRITMEKGENKISLEFRDVNKLIKSETARKFFNYIMIKANEQAIHGGEMTRDHVVFSLQELVDIGFYESTRAARRGFLKASDILTSIKISGTQRKVKKGKTTISSDLVVLFTRASIKSNQCSVTLNYEINWATIIRFFTVLPAYYFKLPGNAADLLEYIFYLARQNVSKIKKQGYFTISFRALHARLALPSENNNHDPKRTIKDPICNAIFYIQEANQKSVYRDDFCISEICDYDAPANEFLDKGYLKLELKGNLATTFIEQADKKEGKQKAAVQRNERVIEKAKIKALEKKLEMQEKDGN